MVGFLVLGSLVPTSLQLPGGAGVRRLGLGIWVGGTCDWLVQSHWFVFTANWGNCGSIFDPESRKLGVLDLGRGSGAGTWDWVVGQWSFSFESPTLLPLSFTLFSTPTHL